MELRPSGLATGIGSLPHTDPAAAVSLVRQYFPVIPHWPQLPKTTSREFFITQCLQFLLDQGLLRVNNGTSATFTSDEPSWPESLAGFYETYLRAASGEEDGFAGCAFPPGAAAGFAQFQEELAANGPGAARFLKGQVVGLLSAGFQITDPERRPAYYDPQLRDLLLKQLSMQAAWQVRTLGKYGLPVLIFMDDPVIDSCGRYDRIGVCKEEVMAELGEFSDFVRKQGGLVGVHSCADLDWALLLETDIDIISFDTYQFAASFALYADLLNTFLKKGGVVAWGIVPTDGDALATEDDTSLQRCTLKFLRTLTAKGLDPVLLRDQALVTPACGTGTLTEPQAERIYELTAGLAASWDDIISKI